MSRKTYERKDRLREGSAQHQKLLCGMLKLLKISSKQFNKPLVSYKCKNELVTITGALNILATGTNLELFSQIKDHFMVNPQLKQINHFAGLCNVGC